jgi:hypothetical protein
MTDDVLHAWVSLPRRIYLDKSAGEEIPRWGTKLWHHRFGMISRKDHILLQDALDFRCESDVSRPRPSSSSGRPGFG